MSIQKIFDEFDITMTVSELLQYWNASHRVYHNESHLADLVRLIGERHNTFGVELHDASLFVKQLFIVACFHDVYYNATSSKNELLSANFFKAVCDYRDNKFIKNIAHAIWTTKHHVGDDELSIAFNALDNDIVTRKFDELLEWEKGIRSEYSMFSDAAYKQGRLFFLKSVPKTTDIDKLIQYVNVTY